MAEADNKKEDNRPDLIAELIGVLLLLFLLFSAFRRVNQNGWQGILENFGLGGDGAGSSYFELYVVPLGQTILSLFTVFSTIVSVFFIVAIIYASTRLSWIDYEWRKQIYPEPKPEGEPEEPRNARWEQVVLHIQSDNPSDWRLAILEADIILDELLDRLGYVGDTIGDKLKIVNKDRFRSVEAAWEAHRIRNAIAHEGQDFVLTQREARRIIGLYEQVFREFDFI